MYRRSFATLREVKRETRGLTCRLAPGTREAARELFAGLRHHLAVDAILAGDEPGEVYVDDAGRPSAGIVLGWSRVYLAGTAGNTAFNRAAAHLLTARRSKEGVSSQVLYHDGGEWAASVASLVPGAATSALGRRFLQLGRLRVDWQSVVPEGLHVRRIDAALLAEGLRHTAELVEEIGSESASVNDFLKKKFGFCVQQGDALLGFCCSEYNRPSACELGVVTLAPYRRQGVATLAVAATVEEALRRGIGEIGWHCWTSNAASLALAAKVGFEPVEEYAVWLCRWSAASESR